MIYEESLKITKDLRAKILEITRLADELVVFVDESTQERENDLDEKIKKLQVLGEKEKMLKAEASKIATQNQEIALAKKANRDKQLSLERKEQEVSEKIKKVQNILN